MIIIIHLSIMKVGKIMASNFKKHLIFYIKGEGIKYRSKNLFTPLLRRVMQNKVMKIESNIYMYLSNYDTRWIESHLYYIYNEGNTNESI